MSEQKYFSILTEYGKQVVLDALRGGDSTLLTTMAFGWGNHDSINGGYVLDPIKDTELRHRWGSVPLDSLRRDPDNKDLLIATGILNNDFVCEIGGPAKGHWINEVALLDNHDETVAICSWPAMHIYIPISEEGSAINTIVLTISKLGILLKEET